jgi:hypothetical protein
MEAWTKLIYKVKGTNRRVLIYQTLLKNKEVHYKIEFKRLHNFQKREISQHEMVLTEKSFLLLKHVLAHVVKQHELDASLKQMTELLKLD